MFQPIRGFKTFLSAPKFLISWPWPPALSYFWKKLNLGIYFLTEKDLAFILSMNIPGHKTFLSVPKFWSITLTSNFDLLLKKKLKLWTERDPERLQKLGSGVLVPDSSDQPETQKLGKTLASDWLRHFQLFLWNHWTEFNETWLEARSQHHLPSFCFSGRSEKEDGYPATDWMRHFQILLLNR